MRIRKKQKRKKRVTLKKTHSKSTKKSKDKNWFNKVVGLTGLFSGG
jgi:hypothetical protein